MHKISSKNIKVSIEKTWKNYQKYAKKYTKSSSSRQRHTLKKYSVVTITVIPRIFVVNFTRKDHAIFKTFRRICQNGLKIPQNDPQQRRRNLLWFFFVESPSTRIITIISAIFDEKRVISSQEIAKKKKEKKHKIRHPPPPPPPHKKKMFSSILSEEWRMWYFLVLPLAKAMQCPKVVSNFWRNYSVY